MKNERPAPLDKLKNERTREQNQNADLLKQINQKKRPRLSGDMIRLIVITVLAMAALPLLLFLVANFEMPDFRITHVDGDGVLSPGGIVDAVDSQRDYSADATYSLEHVFYWESGGTLELPVIGATGWAATNVVLRAEPNNSSASRASLSPGDGFTITDGSVEGWWEVRLPSGTEGWVETRRCFINLPDVLPSIIYNVTNARSSRFTSSYVPLPGVWGRQLYEAHSFNERLGRYEYHVPGMYSLAHALFRVQQSALDNGETLVIYEVFRPRSTQRLVADSLNTLVREDFYVANAFTGAWSVGNFISQGRSNHQLGGAVDAAMGLVHRQEIIRTGDYSFVRNSASSIHGTSSMHELSPEAVLPSNRNSAAGRDVHEVIWNMRDYFVREGFRPLSSEWWHFDHTASISAAASAGIAGEFYTPAIYSVPPVRD
ncbi:MAG: SH3 domain-containing protein [Defluviitaleaceae bacterium]|nr:SH3 domain-containing protein [Defluviitaleaceae bacterium]